MSVIYLYNNAIKVVENLNGNIFPNLKCLYLHNNKIKKIDKLLFDRLRKLYIGYNQIAVIEGLEELYSLEELHVEHQTLPDGMGICFDPRCTLSLSVSIYMIISKRTNIVCLFLSNMGCPILIQSIQLVNVTSKIILLNLFVLLVIDVWYILNKKNIVENIKDSEHIW